MILNMMTVTVLFVVLLGAVMTLLALGWHIGYVFQYLFFKKTKKYYFKEQAEAFFYLGFGITLVLGGYLAMALLDAF